MGLICFCSCCWWMAQSCLCPCPYAPNACFAAGILGAWSNWKSNFFTHSEQLNPTGWFLWDWQPDEGTEWCLVGWSGSAGAAYMWTHVLRCTMLSMHKAPSTAFIRHCKSVSVVPSKCLCSFWNNGLNTIYWFATTVSEGKDLSLHLLKQWKTLENTLLENTPPTAFTGGTSEMLAFSDTTFSQRWRKSTFPCKPASSKKG